MQVGAEKAHRKVGELDDDVSSNAQPLSAKPVFAALTTNGDCAANVSDGKICVMLSWLSGLNVQPP